MPDVLTIQQIGEIYALEDYSDVTYKRRTSETPDFNAGTTAEAFDSSALSVLEGRLNEDPDARRLMAGDKEYRCLRSATVINVGATVLTPRPLDPEPKEGDQIVDGSLTYAVVAWRIETHGYEYRLFCRRI